jgi:hypothetical protein
MISRFLQGFLGTFLVLVVLGACSAKNSTVSLPSSLDDDRLQVASSNLRIPRTAPPLIEAPFLRFVGDSWAHVARPAPKETTLFTDFAQPPQTYSAMMGWAVSGPTNPTYGFYAQAMPLYLKPNDKRARLDVVVIALSYSSGDRNTADLMLFNQVKGLPGDKLKSVVLDGLPDFGTCCTVILWRPKFFDIEPKEALWLVAETVGNTLDAWNMNIVGYNGRFAFSTDPTLKTWKLTEPSTFGAFAIHGSF